MSEKLPHRWFDHYEDPQIGSVRTAEEVLQGDIPLKRYEDRFIHICGGCGHWMQAAHNGYFEDFDYESGIDAAEASGFIDGLAESLCPSCGNVVLRRSGVVATHTAAREFGIDRIQRYMLNRADGLYWRGEADDGIIQASTIEDSIRGTIDWFRVRCPACGEAVSGEADFHHWDYDEDIGCKLCRDCHNHIHRGLRASEQQRKVNTDWEYDAVSRLHELSLKNNLGFGGILDFTHRYNIPIPSTAAEAAYDIFGDDEHAQVSIKELMADE